MALARVYLVSQTAHVRLHPASVGLRLLRRLLRGWLWFWLRCSFCETPLAVVLRRLLGTWSCLICVSKGEMIEVVLGEGELQCQVVMIGLLVVVILLLIVTGILSGDFFMVRDEGLMMILSVFCGVVHR